MRSRHASAVAVAVAVEQHMVLSSYAAAGGTPVRVQLSYALQLVGVGARIYYVVSLCMGLSQFPLSLFVHTNIIMIPCGPIFTILCNEKLILFFFSILVNI